MSKVLLPVSNSHAHQTASAGTSGCVVAGRLAEDSSITILVIEAGEHIDNVAATQMAGG